MTSIPDLEGIAKGGTLELCLLSGDPDQRSVPVARMLVSREVLATASKVFRKLIHKRTIEAGSGDIDRLIIDTFGDDPVAMRVLLRIAHHKAPRKVPLDYDRMLNLALLASKYQCKQMVTPHVRSWLNATKSNVRSVHQHHSRISIAYQLKSAPLFSEMTKYALQTLSFRASDDPEGSENVPEQLKELLSSRIFEINEELRDDLQDSIQSLSTSIYQAENFEQISLCAQCKTSNESSHICDSVERMHAASDFFTNHPFGFDFLSTIPCTSMSGQELQMKLANSVGELEHKCSAGLRCPLVGLIIYLPSQIAAYYEDLEGLYLSDLPDDLIWGI